MDVKRYKNSADFNRENSDFLLSNEAANNLLIGIGNGSKSQHEEDHLLSAVRKDGKSVLVAVMTPPYDILLTPVGNETGAIQVLIEYLAENEISVPGVLAENSTADKFRKFWSERCAKTSTLFREERVYEVRRCNQIDYADGKMRPGYVADIPIVTDMVFGFHEYINEPIDRSSAEKMTESRIRDNRIFVWDNNGVVSICQAARETPNGKVVNLVYTPPDHRRRGYATSLVHALTLQILDGGKDFCCLFTDLSNPTSNNIYQKIGYNPVLDLMHYRFA